MSFNRMISSSEQLFDVLCMDVQNNGSMKVVGRIVVQTDASSQPLSTDTAWKVETLGTTEGSIAYGGPTPVPVVRFHGYTKSHTVDEDLATPKPSPHEQVPGQVWKVREGSEYVYALMEEQSGKGITLEGGTEVLIVRTPPEDLMVRVTILDGPNKGTTGRVDPDILVFVRDTEKAKDTQGGDVI
ncbi:MAG TPA: hypothetical protein VKO18_13575 [Terriglobia bacterium]|nr:hypothetical protein [Terriglobia bacterium]